MVSAGYFIDFFNYTELSNNYDAIYETLMEGGVVWLKINYNNCSNAPDKTNTDGYYYFMITRWYLNYDGLNIVCPEGSVLTFTNGSYTPVSEK